MSLTLDGVSKRFGTHLAVDNVSAAISSGEFFVVLGPSGCGKSTLLRLIAGLEMLDAGNIALDGVPVAGSGVHVAPEQRRVGMVFQSYALWPHMTVEGNVAFPIESAGRPRREAASEAREHLRTVALTGFEQRRPAALSGGQRQRVALARCLAGHTNTILMDEPLANLDPHLRTAMEDELHRFHNVSGATTVYITHDQREAMALAGRIAVMSDGCLIQVDSPQRIYQRPLSPMVAGFIGRSAIVTVDVVGLAGDTCTVQMGGVELRARCSKQARLGPAELVLRPEDVSLRADTAPNGAARVTGQVERARYRGGVWEASVTISGLADFPIASRARLNAGERAEVHLHGGWLLPQGGTTSQ